jgi:type VI secretion system protein ImpL
MKYVIRQLSYIPFKKELLPLILLSILSVTIWFGGPLIAVAEFLPLEHPEKRFYAITFLFIAWFFKIYFYDAKAATRSAFLPNSTELEKKLQTLTDKFEGFISFLTKTFISKNGVETSLSQLPWYLLIGPMGAGKTTLLANANVHFILAKKFNQTTLKNILPSGNCDWWVTRDMVLVDVPSTYIHSKSKKSVSAPIDNVQDSVLWNKFVTLVKKFRGRHALNGVVLAVSLTDLMSEDAQHRNQYMMDLKQRINELRTSFGQQLPFYLTITKCDALPGFIEFFSDSGIDELSQAWGITLPALQTDETLESVFLQRFNALIKKLNKQLITRMHQERNPLARAHIKDFPLYLEQLKESIASLLKGVVTADKSFHLRNVYLTSSLQRTSDAPASHVAHSSISASSQTLAIVQHAGMPSRPYFVRQLLMHGLQEASTRQPRIPTRWQHRPLVYALSAAVTLSAALVIAKDFRINYKQTAAIRTGLAHYQAGIHQQSADMDSALPLLNALENKVNSTTHSLFFHTSQSAAHARTAYQEALQTIIFSQIKNAFSSYLQTLNNKNPEDVYLVLKAYVELGDAQRLQPDFVIQTLRKVAPGLFSEHNSVTALHHIQAAFKLGLQPTSLNPELLAQTRKYIFSVAPISLSYIILKNTDDYSTEVALPLSSNKQNNIEVPKMYTAEYFPVIHNKQVEVAALESMQGNWITGPNSALSGQQNITPLVDQLRSLYITNYADVWENLLANTQLNTPANLSETDGIISSLISNNSPLLQVIHIIKQNTSFTPITATSAKLAAINSQQDRMLNNIIVTLRLLHADLDKILTSHNQANAAFQNAAERMQEQPRQEINDPITQLHKLAETSPEPVKNWLHNIASQSWHYTLQEAGHYAESHWQTDVMSTYRAQFLNRFPLWISATEEVSVSQFVKFLNPQGTLNNYYQSFLAPFVDNKTKKLQWKKMDNEKIPFSDAALEQLQWAQALQTVFFPEEDHQLLVKFTLQPFFLEKNTQSAELSINGQIYQHDRSMPNVPQTLTWPGTLTNHETKITVVNRLNKSMTSAVNGEWGWYRMVNQTATKILSPHELVLSFDVEGHNAKYYLFTKGNINPFLSLPHLRLPDKLEG